MRCENKVKIVFLQQGDFRRGLKKKCSLAGVFVKKISEVLLAFIYRKSLKERCCLISADFFVILEFLPPLRTFESF